MLVGRKVRILNDKELATVNVGENLIIVPSNLRNGKLDIYAINMRNKYVGYVTKMRPNGRTDIMKRDQLREEMTNMVNRASDHNGLSIIGRVVEIEEKYAVVELGSPLRTVLNVDSGKTYGVSNVNYAEIRVAIDNNGEQPVRKWQDTPSPVGYAPSNPHRVNVTNIANPATTTVINKENTGVDSKMNMNMMGNMNMDKIFGGAIGHVNDDRFKLGFDGKIAVKRADGDYITAKANGELTNVNQFAFDMGGTFILPKKLNKVKANDLILRNNEVFIVREDASLKVINVLTQKAEELVATKNMLLGSEFVRVITSPFSMFGGNDKMSGLMMMGMLGNQEGKGAIGGMDMSTLMMMSMINGDKAMDMTKMLPIMMMSGGMGGATGGMGGMNSMLPLIMMGGGNGMGDMFGGMFGDDEPKEKTYTKAEVEQLIADAQTVS